MTLVSFGLSLVLASVSSQTPSVVGGRVELVGPLTGSLSSELSRLAASAAGPTWAGYAVPIVPGAHHLCGDDVVHLEEEGSRETRVEASGPGTLFVLYRLENARVSRIRAVSSGCRIDAGGLALHWWEGVSSVASLAALDSIVSGAKDDRLAQAAIQAIAFHGDRAADESLGRWTASAPSFEARKKAIFWLGAVRGEGGLPVLAAALRSDASRDLREQMVFALNLSSADDALETLVRVARGDRDSRIRERALFWLSQKAGKLAAAAIASAVREDPEVEVKKKAVFALSQLPRDEGVPLLIEVAETHPNPAVRKQAFFWLGQSKDPRALALFERILLEK